MNASARTGEVAHPTSARRSRRQRTVESTSDSKWADSPFPRHPIVATPPQLEFGVALRYLVDRHPRQLLALRAKLIERFTQFRLSLTCGFKIRCQTISLCLESRDLFPRAGQVFFDSPKLRFVRLPPRSRRLDVADEGDVGRTQSK